MNARGIRQFGVHRNLAAASLVALVALFATALPGQAEPRATDATEVIAAALPAQIGTLDPARWCKPVVHLGLVDDASPLTCWLHLTSEQPTVLPDDLLGMNFGDQPPWGDIDVDAIATELDRYVQQLEAERREAERLEEERVRSRILNPAPRPRTDTAAEPEVDYDHARRVMEEWESQDDASFYDGFDRQECAINCNPDVVSDTPPMPAECNGNAGYDTLWGGWKCLGDGS
jgi:hypothetical protein